MCGIIGYSKNKVSHNINQKFIDYGINLLKNRGPDDCGDFYNADQSIGLGHTRLSILDLSKSGSQPMTSLCERYIITFNGEIYNHLSIRQLIEKKRKTIWRGTSDTETLVEAISNFGLEKTLHLLRGMFAFCIFDNKDETISLVRDRLGEN